MNLIPRLSVLAITVSCMLWPAPGRAETDVLPNPGFEIWKSRNASVLRNFDRANVETGSDLIPVGWRIVQTAPENSSPLARVVFSQDSEIKHEGDFSLKITLPEPSGELNISTRDESTWSPMPFAVEPGKSYLLRGWIRTENIQANSNKPGRISVRLADNEKNFFLQETTRRSLKANLPDLASASEWTSFELPVETNSGETWCLVVIDFAPGIQGVIWLDDMRLSLEK